LNPEYFSEAQMDLSIVIVNWNGLRVLRECLGSIYGMEHMTQLEVIVVDNDSSDESVAMVQREFPQVKLVRNSRNLGFAAGNNRGFAAAIGRNVLLLNSDTLLLPGALDASLAFLDANPDVGALGCRVEYPDRSFQTSCYRFSDPHVLLMSRLLPIGSFGRERLNYGRYWGRQFVEPTDVDCVAGAFMMVRLEIINSIGGLDEDFFMYGEDEEWCARIKRGGWRVVYFPNATIIHIHRFSSKQAIKVLRVIECMSPMLVLHKRRGHVVAWLANLVMLAGMTIRLPAWLIVDTIHILRGNDRNGLLQSRFVVLAAHLKGVFHPVWLPRKNQGTIVSNNQKAT
jgi:GT2 family glycosyltransferase